MIIKIVEESNLSQELVEKLFNTFEPVSFKKGSIIFKEGQICKYLYFVEKGALRSYYIDAKGRDISHWFTFENEIITEPKSFFKQTKSNYHLEAMENVELRRISFKKLTDLFNESHEIEKFGRLLGLQLLIDLNDKLLDIQFKSAKERYTSLIEQHPDVFLRVSLGNIASFIGITQQSLSRIRTELMG
ncbi:MAG: CRP-like cAMP-binding protein [Planctomycetota bacterium]|jgi:CRP-like cAMP-binding protein